MKVNEVISINVDEGIYLDQGKIKIDLDTNYHEIKVKGRNGEIITKKLLDPFPLWSKKYKYVSPKNVDKFQTSYTIKKLDDDNYKHPLLPPNIIINSCFVMPWDKAHNFLAWKLIKKEGDAKDYNDFLEFCSNIIINALGNSINNIGIVATPESQWPLVNTFAKKIAAKIPNSKLIEKLLDKTPISQIKIKSTIEDETEQKALNRSLNNARSKEGSDTWEMKKLPFKLPNGFKIRDNFLNLYRINEKNRKKETFLETLKNGKSILIIDDDIFSGSTFRFSLKAIHNAAAELVDERDLEQLKNVQIYGATVFTTSNASVFKKMRDFDHVTTDNEFAGEKIYVPINKSFAPEKPVDPLVFNTTTTKLHDLKHTICQNLISGNIIMPKVFNNKYKIHESWQDFLSRAEFFSVVYLNSLYAPEDKKLLDSNNNYLTDELINEYKREFDWVKRSWIYHVDKTRVELRRNPSITYKNEVSKILDRYNKDGNEVKYQEDLKKLTDRYLNPTEEEFKKWVEDTAWKHIERYNVHI